MTHILTAKQFIAKAEKHGWQLHAIIKEFPAGSGREFLFGFEYSKRSRKRKYKWLTANPVSRHELAKGPILRHVEPVSAPADADSSPDAATANPEAPAGEPATPPGEGPARAVPLGDDQDPRA